MISPDDLASMTVIELKKFARENGISLGSVTAKAAIYQKITERLQQELEEKLSAASPPQESAKQARRAMIISDDSDDTPVLTAAAPVRPAAAAPAQADAPAVPPLPPPAKNKPVFTLQGARAWHNPHPFSPQSSAKFAPQAGPQINLAPFAGHNLPEALQSAAQQPRQALPYAPRFGPEAKAAQPEPAAPPVPQHVYRPAAFTAPVAPRPMPAAPAYYQPGYRGPVFQGQPQLEEGAQPQNAGGLPPLSAPYQRPAYPEYPSEAGPAVRPFSAAGLAGRAREAGQPFAREFGGVNPAVPEMLATGDCGDGAGVLEIHPDGYGFLRAGNYLIGKNDVYVSNAQIRRFRLRNGDHVEGKTRPQRDTDRYAAMLYITKINGEEAEDVGERKNFDELTPVYPNRRINLSSQDENDMVLRLIDMFSPVGYGQRAMIVAAPKAGKTTILKKIAMAIRKQHENIHLMMLLVDERPEEVTDLKETVGGDILYSTFDEPAENHIRVSELVLERAMRLVEKGGDVVVLMDSLTRLSRAYNTLAPSTARVMSGGLAAGVLNKPKRFFGAARNLKEGGSLTVIATALIETGSRMDDVIFEEFKGTGNMELTLDRQLSEMRVFPAVSVARSGTRHEELLLSSEEIRVAEKIRGMISGASEQNGVSMILSMMEKTKDNDDFVARFDDWMALMKNSSYSPPGRQY